MKAFFIFVGVVAAIIILTCYYSILANRIIYMLKPVILPPLKKLYEGFLKKDEEISGTERIAKSAHYGDERYMDPNDPHNPYMYKKVSVKIVGMLLAVLSIFINTWYGRIIINFYFISLVFELVFFVIRNQDKESYKDYRAPRTKQVGTQIIKLKKNRFYLREISHMTKVEKIFNFCIIQIALSILVYLIFKI